MTKLHVRDLKLYLCSSWLKGSLTQTLHLCVSKHLGLPPADTQFIISVKFQQMQTLHQLKCDILCRQSKLVSIASTFQLNISLTAWWVLPYAEMLRNQIYMSLVKSFESVFDDEQQGPWEAQRKEKVIKNKLDNCPLFRLTASWLD